MQDYTLTYKIPEWVAFVLALWAIGYAIAWYGFRLRARRLEDRLAQSGEEVETLTSRLQQADAEAFRRETNLAGFKQNCESLKRECETLKQQLADREIGPERADEKEAAAEELSAGRKAEVEEIHRALQEKGKTFVREWAGFYQVIVKSFLDMTVQVRGYIQFAGRLERHDFDITIDPGEEYPKIVRTTPGSPV